MRRRRALAHPCLRDSSVSRRAGARGSGPALLGRRARQLFSCKMLGKLAPLRTIVSVWFAAEKIGALADCTGTHVCVAASKNSIVGGTETSAGRSKTMETEVASGLTEVL